MSEQVFVVTASEMAAMHGAGPLAGFIYAHLRQWMDYGTGVVGRTRAISLAMLSAYAETHTPRGQGTEITQPSEKMIRTAIERLVRAGLLRRLPGDRLCFWLPLAQTAHPRPNQTGRDAGAESSTEPGAVEAMCHKATEHEPGTVSAPRAPAVRAHIRVQENQNLTAGHRVPVDNSRASGADRERRSARDRGEARPVPNAGADGEQRLLKIGRQRGINPRPGESWQDFRARLFAPKRQPERTTGSAQGLHALGGWLGLPALAHGQGGTA